MLLRVRSWLSTQLFGRQCRFGRQLVLFGSQKCCLAKTTCLLYREKTKVQSSGCQTKCPPPGRLIETDGWVPLSEFLTQQDLGGAQELASLIGSLMMLILLVWRTTVRTHCFGTMAPKLQCAKYFLEGLTKSVCSRVLTSRNSDLGSLGGSLGICIFKYPS